MKKFFKFLFKGLISNQEVIDTSNDYPKWAGIIALVFSAVVAVIPAFTSIAKTQGSSIVSSSSNASLDTSLVLLSKYLGDNDIDITIKDDGKLDVTKEINPSGEDKFEYLVKAQDRTLLAVRVITTKDDPSTVENEEVKAIEKYRTMYASGQAKLDSEVTVRPVSNIIFSETYVYVTTYLYTDSVVNTIEEGVVKTFAQTNSTFAGLTKDAPKTSIKSFYNKTNDKPIDVCVSKWKTLFNDLYSSSKTQYLWTYSGIIVGINASVALLVSLLVMILTRLKSSTGTKLNYLEAMNIVGFASICPAILSVLIGFLIPQLTQIGFILMLGLRTTFLGMKASNPQPRQ